MIRLHKIIERIVHYVKSKSSQLAQDLPCMKTARFQLETYSCNHIQGKKSNMKEYNLYV